MNEQVQKQLETLTQDFYSQVCDSFSKTRDHGWPGWERVLTHVEPLDRELTVLDIACGNMRFKDFLDSHCASTIVYRGIDSCASLVPTECQDAFIQADVLGLAHAGALGSLTPPKGHLVACFGFMHHIPSSRLRLSFLEQALEMVEPGGLLAVSFWQFMKDGRIAAKARQTTAKAHEALGLHDQLEGDDWLLGWKETDKVWRYCHNFTDDEVDGLVSSLQQDARAIDSFHADGKANDLNRYVILQKL